jgi:hypothetical protein
MDRHTKQEEKQVKADLFEMVLKLEQKMLLLDSRLEDLLKSFKNISDQLKKNNHNNTMLDKR